MSSKPKVSVYLPVYNGDPYICAAIGSILDQTFQDFELIVVNDGSTDRTADIVAEIDDPRIRLINQENRGCYPARNRAIEGARGEFLANMDADDISLPERLEQQVQYLEENTEAGLVGTATYGCDQEDTIRLRQPQLFEYDPSTPVPHAVPFDCTQYSAAFACQTILYRRSLVERMGHYDDRLCFSADVEFVARAACEGVVACLPDPLYVFRLIPSAISGAGSTIQREIISIIAAASHRYAEGKGREFTEEEVNRLSALSEKRQDLPSTSQRIKEAYYHTRLATLHRVNGHPTECLKHSLRAAFLAPGNLLSDRKLVSNFVKFGFGSRANTSVDG